MKITLFPFRSKRFYFDFVRPIQNSNEWFLRCSSSSVEDTRRFTVRDRGLRIFCHTEAITVRWRSRLMCAINVSREIRLYLPPPRAVPTIKNTCRPPERVEIFPKVRTRIHWLSRGTAHGDTYTRAPLPAPPGRGFLLIFIGAATRTTARPYILRPPADCATVHNTCRCARV